LSNPEILTLSTVNMTAAAVLDFRGK